jgi:hypothetical protein
MTTETAHKFTTARKHVSIVRVEVQNSGAVYGWHGSRIVLTNSDGEETVVAETRSPSGLGTMAAGIAKAFYLSEWFQKTDSRPATRYEV